MQSLPGLTTQPGELITQKPPLCCPPPPPAQELAASWGQSRGLRQHMESPPSPVLHPHLHRIHEALFSLGPYVPSCAGLLLCCSPNCSFRCTRPVLPPVPTPRPDFAKSITAPSSPPQWLCRNKMPPPLPAVKGLMSLWGGATPLKRALNQTTKRLRSTPPTDPKPHAPPHPKKARKSMKTIGKKKHSSIHLDL